MFIKDNIFVINPIFNSQNYSLNSYIQQHAKHSSINKIHIYLHFQELESCNGSNWKYTGGRKTIILGIILISFDKSQERK